MPKSGTSPRAGSVLSHVLSNLGLGANKAPGAPLAAWGASETDRRAGEVWTPPTRSSCTLPCPAAGWAPWTEPAGVVGLHPPGKSPSLRLTRPAPLAFVMPLHTRARGALAKEGLAVKDEGVSHPQWCLSRHLEGMKPVQSLTTRLLRCQPGPQPHP